jgi:hypothetical protein
MIFGVRLFQFDGGTSLLAPWVIPSQIILLYVFFYFNHVYCLWSSGTGFLATYKIHISLEVLKFISMQNYGYPSNIITMFVIQIN